MREVTTVTTVELPELTGPDDDAGDPCVELPGITVIVLVTGTVTTDVMLVVSVPDPEGLVAGAVEDVPVELVKTGDDRLPDGMPLPVLVPVAAVPEYPVPEWVGVVDEFKVTVMV